MKSNNLGIIQKTIVGAKTPDVWRGKAIEEIFEE